MNTHMDKVEYSVTAQVQTEYCVTKFTKSGSACSNVLVARFGNQDEADDYAKRMNADARGYRRVPAEENGAGK